jgi:hypothetical protein
VAPVHYRGFASHEADMGAVVWPFPMASSQDPADPIASVQQERFLAFGRFGPCSVAGTGCDPRKPRVGWEWGCTAAGNREELCRIVVERVVVRDRQIEAIEWTPPMRPFLDQKRQRECPQGASGTRPLSFDAVLEWYVA